MDNFITLGSFEIKWYSVIILLAFIIGYFLTRNQAKKNNIEESLILDLLCWLIPICIIGARIYYVIFEWHYYSKNLTDIIKVWEGGLAIHGGIIAGLIFLAHFCKKNKLKFFTMADMIVPSLILGQAIGRWGNFFNQEAYGPITTYIELKNQHIPNFIIEGMYINGSYHIPTFFYESIWCIIGFITLILIRKVKIIKSGQLTGIYFIFYALGRFYIESLRQDSLMLLNLKVAQLVSILMILVGIVLLIYPIFKNKKKI